MRKIDLIRTSGFWGLVSSKGLYEDTGPTGDSVLLGQVFKKGLVVSEDEFLRTSQLMSE